jgi:hypothetical protein
MASRPLVIAVRENSLLLLYAQNTSLVITLGFATRRTSQFCRSLVLPHLDTDHVATTFVARGL